MAHAGLQELQHAVVVAVHIEQADGLVVVAQLAPSPDLEQFLEGAYAAGQGDEGIAALGHHGLALVHGLDDVQFVAGMVGQLLVHQRLRDHSHDAATGLPRGLGHLAHQAAAPAAVDQLAAVLANPAAGGAGGLDETGLVAGARAAIHTNGKRGICHAMNR